MTRQVLTDAQILAIWIANKESPRGFARALEAAVLAAVKLDTRDDML